MGYTQREVDGKTVLYASDWIHDLESRRHFLWYWTQARLVYDHAERSDLLLELGCGANLLSDLLRRRGFQIKTLDIDPVKSPDYCADALAFDYNKEDFKTLLAFEVFEHIPWATLEGVVKEVGKSGIRKILFSVPRQERVHRLASISTKGGITFDFCAPRFRRAKLIPTHFWEMSSRRNAGTYGDGELRSRHEIAGMFANAGFGLQDARKEGRIRFMVASRTDG